MRYMYWVEVSLGLTGGSDCFGCLGEIVEVGVVYFDDVVIFLAEDMTMMANGGGVSIWDLCSLIVI